VIKFLTRFTPPQSDRAYQSEIRIQPPGKRFSFPAARIPTVGCSPVKKFLSILSTLEGVFIGCLLISITFILFGNVMSRFLFNSSLSWAEEFSRYAVVWITMIGSSVCVTKGAHIAIDPLSPFLSTKAQRLMHLGVLVICIASTSMLGWYASKLTLKITKLNQMSATLEVPMTYVYGALPIGFGLMTIHFLYALFIFLTGFRTETGDLT